ncbi:MAG TPA: PBP1A family penicillin-binding protein [Oscillatoriaceae cyanobacterium M33_DOE_052]|uniref:PBP1A family penicillin-binding protein n=1 Tax=Planktothricoides sp. SpSt-374 TaxID=2282167 RepID=A0A7C3VHK0_9CYAN|nr:PBP1A family penicillin-binding protein [Oscillatoriaceae cyanobacterium M33_DOE_052]
MSAPQPPKPPKTILSVFTQAVQTVQARINMSLKLKPNARVPELRVKDGESATPQVYKLLGNRYILGRSAKTCDIVVSHPLVSQVHLTVYRDGQERDAPFYIKDEKSTNGIYRGKRRISQILLRHGDAFTLGPPELADVVEMRYLDPPPWYVLALRWSLIAAGGTTALVALFVGLEWQKFPVNPLPRGITGPVVVYARDGQTPLQPSYNSAHREFEKLSNYSKYLPNAVIASEDSRFYWHLGVDPIGIARAVVANLRGGGIREGASTLTQQLARSLFREYVGTADSAGRKIREALVALKLETFYSKDDLLLTYLNRVYLGFDLYGFDDAARFYFEKSAADLTLSEAATLVGILPAPNSFNPVQNYQLAVRYRNGVLYRMERLGMIDADEADRARRSLIQVSPRAKEILSNTIAPYLWTYVFRELDDLLGEDVAREGNFIVETGLDPELQTQMEAALVRGVSDGVNGFSQGAMVTVDARTGEILALAGGVDFMQSQFNRATQAERQPGSTFKIFAYTAALEMGISPDTTYSCEPLRWQGTSYSGCERSGGVVDMWRGLAQSENAIALRVAQQTGLDKVVQTARRMGIQSKLNSVPGLVLGQSEVTLLEMTGAYSVLANGGKRNRPHAINRILDSSDCQDPTNPQTCRLIYDYQQQPGANRQVIPADVARTMTRMLQGVVANGTGGNASIGLGEEAGKTGTTNDGVDLWFVGYVPSRDLVTGVWLGNDDNSPTNSGSALAASVWADFTRRAIGN